MQACFADTVVGLDADECLKQPPADSLGGLLPKPQAMHYPHRISKVKRARKLGFRARMRTKNGRRIINNKRRRGQKAQAV